HLQLVQGSHEVQDTLLGADRKSPPRECFPRQLLAPGSHDPPVADSLPPKVGSWRFRQAEQSCLSPIAAIHYCSPPDTVSHFLPSNRDREGPHGLPPPTPPDVRVTYPAVRRIGLIIMKASSFWHTEVHHVHLVLARRSLRG